MKNRVPLDYPQPPPGFLPNTPASAHGEKVWTNPKSAIKTACQKAWGMPCCAPPRFLNMPEVDLRMSKRLQQATSMRLPGAGSDMQKQKPGKRKQTASATSIPKSGI